jgi:hypothetical protein
MECRSISLADGFEMRDIRKSKADLLAVFMVCLAGLQRRYSSSVDRVFWILDAESDQPSNSQQD